MALSIAFSSEGHSGGRGGMVAGRRRESWQEIRDNFALLIPGMGGVGRCVPN